MIRILIFEPSPQHGRLLARAIRSALGPRGLLAQFDFRQPGDVFTSPMPSDAWAAFFTLTSMYDLEAARKFSCVYRAVPLLVVSDSAEYALLSWHIGARYYLERPCPAGEIGAALLKCAR